MSDAPTSPESPRDESAALSDATPEAAASEQAKPEPSALRTNPFQVVDLSSPDGGRSSTEPTSWKRKRKQASPILTKIVDLSAQTPPKAEAKTAPPKAKPQRASAPKGKPKGKSDTRSPRGGGSTLADLLDPETLARLRGDD